MLMTESLMSWMEGQQTELNQCLIELANIPPEESVDGEICDDLKSVGGQMLEIYSRRGEEFRHQYHLLSEVIKTFDGEQLDSIPRNLNKLIDYFRNSRDKCAIKFVKLYDHLSIEIERNRDHRSLEQLSTKICTSGRTLFTVLQIWRISSMDKVLLSS